MDGLRIFIDENRITVSNERVHLAFERHFTDELKPGATAVMCIQGTDINRLFSAINVLNDLSIGPPALNTHIPQDNGESRYQNLEEIAKETENEKRQPVKK